eukprot:TRINITY_DN68476_c0_g1_i1.p1 TRINITY_DN68476_c0_g1~~TRINITY_DN68476_c0_g1_i1.p1  ORF type:complete len:395 (-),score=38.43 TRINITY_DN68476_c0_g1_i1:644-1678(-)
MQLARLVGAQVKLTIIQEEHNIAVEVCSHENIDFTLASGPHHYLNMSHYRPDVDLSCYFKPVKQVGMDAEGRFAQVQSELESLARRYQALKALLDEAQANPMHHAFPRRASTVSFTSGTSTEDSLTATSVQPPHDNPLPDQPQNKRPRTERSVSPAGTDNMVVNDQPHIQPPTVPCPEVGGQMPFFADILSPLTPTTLQQHEQFSKQETVPRIVHQPQPTLPCHATRTAQWAVAVNQEQATPAWMTTGTTNCSAGEHVTPTNESPQSMTEGVLATGPAAAGSSSFNQSPFAGLSSGCNWFGFTQPDESQPAPVDFQQPLNSQLLSDAFCNSESLEMPPSDADML